MQSKRTQLAIQYQQFSKKKRSTSSLLRAFRAAMPELIYRTTKLEGEPITRRMVRSIHFKITVVT